MLRYWQEHYTSGINRKIYKQIVYTFICKAVYKKNQISAKKTYMFKIIVLNQ